MPKIFYLFKSSNIFFVGQRTSGVDGTQMKRTQRNLLVRPMNQVFGYRVPPMHRAPLGVVGIVLIEEMVVAVIVDKAVWIVQPSLWHTEV